MKKKMLINLIMVIILALFINYVYAASDTIYPKLTLTSNSKAVKVGEEIVLTITASDLTENTIDSVKVSYDASKVSYVSGGSLESEGNVGYADVISEEGKVLTFKFKVNEGASGNIIFKVSGKCYDATGEYLATPTYKDLTKISVYEKSKVNSISYISINNKSNLDFTNNIYSIMLSNETKKAQICIKSDNNATVRIKRSDVLLTEQTGEVEKEVDLPNINNTFKIEIVAENGDLKSYSLRINREPDSTVNNVLPKEESKKDKTKENLPENKQEENIVVEEEKSCLLKSLVVSHGNMTPEFYKETFAYGMKVDLSVDRINVTAVPEDSNAVVEVSGNEDLKQGINLIKIKVSNEKENKIYTITVNKTDGKNENDATLQFLNIDNVELSPEFNPEVLEYTCIIPLEIDSLNISTLATQEGTTLTILGNESLKVGENTIIIEVVSESGEVTKDYVIKALKIDQIYEGAVNETKTLEKMQIDKRTFIIIILIIVILVIGILTLVIAYKNEREKIKAAVIKDIENKSK